MAYQQLIQLPNSVWTKIATNVQAGHIIIRSNAPNDYLHDFRKTGDTAPIDDSFANRFDKSGREIIQSSYAIDVYAKSRIADGIVLVLI